jgi:hypothetical protein
MADYSANPLADPDKQFSRIRLLRLMIYYLLAPKFTHSYGLSGDKAMDIP